jgi:hypothetical protein
MDLTSAFSNGIEPSACPLDKWTYSSTNASTISSVLAAITNVSRSKASFFSQTANVLAPTRSPSSLGQNQGANRNWCNPTLQGALEATLLSDHLLVGCTVDALTGSAIAWIEPSQPCATNYGPRAGVPSEPG